MTGLSLVAFGMFADNKDNSGVSSRTRAAPLRLALQWLESQSAVESHIAPLLLQARLTKEKLIVVDDFLPFEVASRASSLVLEDAARNEKGNWSSMSYEEVAHEADAIAHDFDYAEAEDISGGEHLSDAVSWIFPDLIPVFSIARYTEGHHIDAHDDKAHVPIEMKGKGEVLHSRKYAAIYYLTPTWKASYGGVLVDEVTGTHIVPKFNRLVLFEVPRLHRVTAVRPNAPPRLSVFGWWLTPGKLYELDVDDDDDDNDDDE